MRVRASCLSISGYDVWITGAYWLAQGAASNLGSLFWRRLGAESLVQYGWVVVSRTHLCTYARTHARTRAQMMQMLLRHNGLLSECKHV